MEYKGYHANILYDEDDKLFVGTIVGINDLVSFHGTTVSELENHFKDSVDEYLAFCQRVGKKPDKEYKGSFNVRISPELHRKLAEKAILSHKSLNSAVESAIEQYVS